jgi:hypothetical protein
LKQVKVGVRPQIIYGMAAMQSSPPYDARTPLPNANAASIGGRDISSYLAMLARQLTDNMAVSNRLALSLRWLASPLTDSLVRQGEAAKSGDLKTAALILTGSRNHTALGGYALDPSIDVIRLELRAAGITERAFSYARSGSDLPPLCAAEDFSSFVRAIRRRAADRDADQQIEYGGGFAQVLAHVSQASGLPPHLAQPWLRRQLRLLSASRLMFLGLWKTGMPEVLMCHGGLNFITAGAKLAAAESDVPAFEIQHGALNMLDPMRRNSPLSTYGGEQLLAWLRHGDSGREFVLGPPQFRMHRWLTGDSHRQTGLIPSSVVEDYHAALAAATREKSGSGKAAVLVAMQKNGAETERAKALGLDLTQVQLWLRGHPAHTRRKTATGVFSANALPMGALLSEADWLFTGHSSAAAEAAAFGCGVKFLMADGALLYPGVESGADEFSKFPTRPQSSGRPACVSFGGWAAGLRANNWQTR